MTFFNCLSAVTRLALEFNAAAMIIASGNFILYFFLILIIFPMSVVSLLSIPRISILLHNLLKRILSSFFNDRNNYNHTLLKINIKQKFSLKKAFLSNKKIHNNIILKNLTYYFIWYNNIFYLAPFVGVILHNAKNEKIVMIYCFAWVMIFLIIVEILSFFRFPIISY